MKHIVIDARLYGSKHTGIGRYTKNLLLALKGLPNFKNYRFSLIVYQDLLSTIKSDLGGDFNLVPTTIPHYSLKEQIFLPFLLYKLKPDLVHFTHFNKPVFYFGKSVVTIHDLIKHFFKGKETTTKNQVFYWVKYFGYLVLTTLVIKTSKIIVPSNYWRDYLIKNFKIKSQDITTTYEAVDPKFLENTKSEKSTAENYILYTGNLYPHKNIGVVLDALTDLPNLKLKIICARNVFSQRLMASIENKKISSQVEFLGYLIDSQFKKVYSKALALVHPSLMEGFSLTGLEAMALNCPVISSNSSCLPEIYGDSVLYFDPQNPKDLVKKIKSLQASKDLRQKLISLGNRHLQKYSWDKTAMETFDVYQKELE